MTPEETRAEIERHKLAAWGMQLSVELHDSLGNRKAMHDCIRRGLSHLAEIDRLTAQLERADADH